MALRHPYVYFIEINDISYIVGISSEDSKESEGLQNFDNLGMNVGKDEKLVLLEFISWKLAVTCLPWDPNGKLEDCKGVRQ